MIGEVFSEILETFVNSENQTNSLASKIALFFDTKMSVKYLYLKLFKVAFASRMLTEAQNVPSIRVVENIGIYVTILTLLLEVVKCLMNISFSDDKQELRNKIARIFY